MTVKKSVPFPREGDFRQYRNCTFVISVGAGGFTALKKQGNILRRGPEVSPAPLGSTGRLSCQAMASLIRERELVLGGVEASVSKPCFYFDSFSADCLSPSSSHWSHQSDRRSASIRLINDIYVTGKLLLSANHRIYEWVFRDRPWRSETNGGTGRQRNPEAIRKSFSAACPHVRAVGRAPFPVWVKLTNARADLLGSCRPTSRSSGVRRG